MYTKWKFFELNSFEVTNNNVMITVFIYLFHDLLPYHHSIINYERERQTLIRDLLLPIKHAKSIHYKKQLLGKFWEKYKAHF